MADLFLSYARANQAQAAALAQAVEQGGRSAWWDRRLASGDDYGRVIERELDAAAAVLVAWSRPARDSLWVRAEANAALDQGKLVQLTLDGAPLPLPFTMLHVLDFRFWEGSRAQPPWPELEAELVRRTGGPGPGQGRRADPGGVPFVPPAERALQGYGQVALLGWTALAAALLMGIVVVAGARGNIGGEALGVISVIVLALSVGLLAVSAFIFGRAIRTSGR